jgi:hypothetical protein
MLMFLKVCVHVDAVISRAKYSFYYLSRFCNHGMPCYGLKLIYIRFESSVLTTQRTYCVYLISNFRRVVNIVCFLLGDSPASEFIRRGITQKKADNILRFYYNTQTVNFVMGNKRCLLQQTKHVSPLLSAEFLFVKPCGTSSNHGTCYGLCR